jgi:hypothetical protein
MGFDVSFSDVKTMLGKPLLRIEYEPSGSIVTATAMICEHVSKTAHGMVTAINTALEPLC